MKKIITVVLLSILFSTTVTAMDNNSNSFIFSIVFNIGSFSAGENDGGSVFLGWSISVDWIPSSRTGLIIGLETGLQNGKKQNSENVIMGIPIILRFGWQPNFLNFGNISLFVIGKAGWGFGIWGSELENGSTPGGIVCGINLGGRYTLSSRLSVCTEVGYNYYGLARNVYYPEYPLGYGSGKAYTSIGISFY